jgi:hypothetical protein
VFPKARSRHSRTNADGGVDKLEISFHLPNGEQFALLDEPEPVEALPDQGRRLPAPTLENDGRLSRRRVRLADLMPVRDGNGWMR